MNLLEYEKVFCCFENMSIYTKKGDKGKTSLGSGLKVWKNSARVEAYGTVDELNANLGVIRAGLDMVKKGYAAYLSKITLQIQDDLFSIGAYLANPANSELLFELSKRTILFEKYIDEMTEKMGEVTNFTIPGGALIASQLHVARTICRRAERKLIGLIRQETVNEEVVKYINRLSDLLFTMNRYVNYNEKKKEVIWKRR